MRWLANCTPFLATATCVMVITQIGVTGPTFAFAILIMALITSLAFACEVHYNVRHLMPGFPEAGIYLWFIVALTQLFRLFVLL